MRKKHNGFTKFMRKRDGKSTVKTNRSIEVGDKVLVKGIELTASHLGTPRNFVGEVRQVYTVRELLSSEMMYSLCPNNHGAWYVAEDLEIVT